MEHFLEDPEDPPVYSQPTRAVLAALAIGTVVLALYGVYAIIIGLI